METDRLVQRAFGERARVTSCIEMEKGASTRRYFRLGLSGAPLRSLVLMSLPDDTMKSDELIAGGTPRELPFLNVQRHLAAAGLPVPEIHLDAVSEGAVLLEDLGTTTFNARVRELPPDALETWYLAAVALLARMHGAMWPVPSGCQARERFFDFTLLRWELDHYREWGLEARTGSPLSAVVRRRLDAAFDDFAAELDALPKGFVHRDYQSRNLMVTADAPLPESLVIIDFQDAFIGPRVYDLVALLNDSYVEIADDAKDRIILRYAALRDLDPKAVRREFDLLTVQRKLKDGGRFIFIDRIRRDPSFLPFVETSFRRVRRALQRIEGHESLKSALSEADPEWFGQS